MTDMLYCMNSLIYGASEMEVPGLPNIIISVHIFVAICSLSLSRLQIADTLLRDVQYNLAPVHGSHES